MKRISANLLSVLCWGCSSAKPEQKQSAAAEPPSIQQPKYLTHTNHVFMAFMDGWLKKAPAPDPSNADLPGGLGVYYSFLTFLAVAPLVVK